MRQIIQIPITDSILNYYFTYDTVQRVWINQAVLVFFGLNIKIETDGSSITPPLCPCPKVTHILKEFLMGLIIIFKELNDKGRWFKHTV